MKLLALDIETAPAIVYAWGLWDQNVGVKQVIEQPRMLCFAAKWIGRPGVTFRSEFHDGKQAMLDRIHAMLSEADCVLHYNGDQFDMKHLHREFLQAGMDPPAPSLSIDLLKEVRRNFRFLSNKLENVSQVLGLEGKVEHSGFSLWRDCMAGDASAWARMREYNRRDVTLLEDLYNVLLPWIRTHPNLSLIDGTPVDGCPRCGSEDYQRRGVRLTGSSVYQRFKCNRCRGFFRAAKRDTMVPTSQSRPA